MEWETAAIIVVAILAFLVFLRGALELLILAAEQGFIGLAAFVACWVFMVPAMTGLACWWGCWL